MQLSKVLLGGLVKKPLRSNNATVRENRKKDLKRVLANESFLKQYPLKAWNFSNKTQRRANIDYIAKDNRRKLSELSKHERTVEVLKNQKLSGDNL